MGGWLGIAKIKPTQPQLGLAGALAELGNIFITSNSEEIDLFVIFSVVEEVKVFILKWSQSAQSVLVFNMFMSVLWATNEYLFSFGRKLIFMPLLCLIQIYIEIPEIS